MNKAVKEKRGRKMEDNGHVEEMGKLQRTGHKGRREYA